MHKRSLILAAAALAVTTLTASAQTSWPSKPVTLVVPFPPGGPVDTLGRVIAPKLGEKLGQTVVIDNKAGAGGSIGVNAVIKAEPDGYTFGFGSPGALTVLPHLQKLPYEVEKVNFVSLVAHVPQVIALSPKLEAKSLKDLIALAKKSPGALNYGSAGKATTTHLGAELLSQEAGISMTHVPYKGAAPARTALLSGEVQLFAADLPAVLPLVSKGVSIVAVSGAKRVELLPDVPSTAELGLASVQVASNYGLIAPAATPAAITDKFRAALHAVLAMPEIRKQILNLGAIPSPTSSAAYRELMLGESARWGAVIKKANISLN